jgi:glycosyltransferase 2 family protein
MHPRFRRWAWPICKALLAVAILVAVGLQFWRDLRHESLQDLSIRWQWLILSGLLYFIGMSFSGWYWYRLLVTFGEKPSLRTAYRAYFVSQLGKYLPGKAWALIMRGTLIQGPDVKLSVALIATFYEVLTTMVSGSLLAVALFVILQSSLLNPSSSGGRRGDDYVPLILGLGLLAVCGIPLLPGVFNRAIGILAGRFGYVERYKLPGMRLGTLFEGLIITSGVWVFFGFSLWAMIQGLLSHPQDLTFFVWARYTASTALACVAGFVAIVVPGGLGVREWVLDRMLMPELTAAAVFAVGAPTAVIVLLLRLVWITSEVVLAGLFWLVPTKRRHSA